MKKLNNLFLPAFAAFAFLLISCGGGSKNNDSSTGQQNNANNSPAAAANNMAAGMNAMANANASVNSDYAEKMKERRAKGDTLAMPYTDLQKYLPTSVDGYTVGTPDGASINMGKMSYSSANIQFKKDNGDWVKVTILDYNQAYNMYASATAVWGMGISVDSPEEKSNSIKLENTAGGFESYKKKTKNASIVLGVGSRFYLSVEANNQPDAGMVESVAKSIDLSKLSTL
ncbi:MAG: hypothetical protein ACLQQ4_06860 [Bacteroidia bacterium]